ncbi:large conductance mechanosensitive channel protein MscL [Altererythrobacter sp. KTW20L]|uniref:large conductance mechanosensitive channel protein MscL n=1 Tax=Altererythrobacter sp. KTW20L TaxID=2942210 RepID=UPI0020C09D93|nr:large conductance mechanosensitive channel protein MscL [Altererythrobacter sp. KTW20L]MCL6250734.1 large conductance mechanosensitive channel protein MscL [Altererythrobacter sp. KTW20L]
MLSEFKAFIAKGNVLDLAVAVIIGAAFGTIVSSLTDDIIMPLVGSLVGDVDFSNLYVVLSGAVPEGTSLAAAREAGANVLAWGNFISVAINFLILAFVIFLLVRQANKLMAKKEVEEAAAPTGPTEIELLTEIRDALKK